MTFELKPFRIGSLTVNLPVTLAPMAGYTDLIYRTICRRFGAEYCTTEMLLDRLTLMKGKVQARMLRTGPQDHPVAAQIVGNEPASMAQAAKAVEDMGFDVIDLNFACPVHKALSRRRGGYMMCQVQPVRDIIRAVCQVATKPVTIKVRQKYRSADNEDNFWAIAEAAFDFGVSAITVHGRSVETKYFGPADWEFIASVKRHFGSRTIVGSGDVLTPAKALEMLRQTGVDAVAVARGGLGNPWFFRQLLDLAAGRPMYAPSLAEQREVLLHHFAEDCAMYGDDKGPKHMRGFAVKYAKMHPTPKDLRIAFVAVRSPQQWREVVDRYYAGQTHADGETPMPNDQGPMTS